MKLPAIALWIGITFAGTASARMVVQPSKIQIHAVLDAQVEAWNRGDVEAFMQGYRNSPSTSFVTATGILRGWETVLARYKKSYPDRAAMGTLTFSDLDINVLSPNAAYVVGHWQLQREHDQPGGVFTLIFRKFPEGWRIVHDHTTAFKPQ
jgi:ketosteroid isomerase-like protein